MHLTRLSAAINGDGPASIFLHHRFNIAGLRPSAYVSENDHWATVPGPGTGRECQMFYGLTISPMKEFLRY